MKALQFPMARITIAFIFGILLAYFFKPLPYLVFGFFSITILFFIGIFFYSKRNTKFQLHFGIATYLLSFFIGAAILVLHTEHFQKNNYTQFKKIYDKNHTFTLTIREKIKNSTFSERYIALINTIDHEKSTGKILLNISKDSTISTLKVGSIIKLKTQLTKNTFQKNPNQFDYKKYLEDKQIYAQLYVYPNEIQISTEFKKDIWYYSDLLRNRIIHNLEKAKFNSKELNVAVALIMGQQQNIDSEIIQDYQYAGAVHILSVSGLHIGFILLFITLLLKPFPNNRKGAFIKLIITIVILFLFGFFVGLAPSVVRSVTMFSFVAIGRFLRRSTNIFHTLLVSMLLILFVQPYFLFDVGFQLSYTALFFILWLQPLLAKLWIPKNKIINYFWEILTVSFAAQIGTLPLSIYYFHQFPGLFLLTNLVIIPYLSLIMALGVLVMVLAAFNCLPYFLSKALELSISFLDKIISRIASFEQFIFKEIPLNTSLLVSSYLIIITIIIAFEKKRYINYIYLLLAVITFQISAIFTKWDVQKQNELIVFNSPKNTQIIERNGTNAILFSKKDPIKNSKNNTIINSYLTTNFSVLKQESIIMNLIYFKGNKILLIDSSMVYPKSIYPDVLLLTQSPKVNLERMLKTLQPKIVVADGSNYKSFQKIWKITCNQQKIPFHSTNEKGFYKIE